MTNKKNPTFKPLDCDEMERSIQLCNGIEYLIDDFLREISGKEPGQLFKAEFQVHLMKIVSHLDELLQRLTYLTDKNNKAFYFDHLFSILKALSCSPNTLIIAAHYLNPENQFKRFLNRNTFEFEMNQIVKKIQFIKPVLQSLFVGRKTGVKNITRSI